MVPLDISGLDAKVLARRLEGAGIPGGADANVLKEWYTLFSSDSEHLRKELAQWSDFLANKHPPCVAIWAMMAYHLVALYTSHGVLPVVIGYIIHHLLVKCVMLLKSTTKT